MILAIDIGNTTVSIATIKRMRIDEISTIDIGISQVELRAELQNIFKRIKKEYPFLEQVILCSVVPEVLDIVEREVSLHLKVKPAVIGRTIKVPIKNNYRKPRQVGQDRLICGFAAKSLYGAPAIVIDFGTAITFDVISKKGHYEGGIIVPGIRLSAEALYKKTALLPQVESKKTPRNLIGKDTKESILSGIFNGYGLMCVGIIDKITKKIGGRPKVIVTGGHTHLMKKYIVKKVTRIDKNLVFKGMALLVENS